MLIIVYFKGLEGLGGVLWFVGLGFFTVLVFIIRNKENYKSSYWLFQASSNHNIEKFLIIPFLIYADIILPYCSELLLPFLSNHYILQSRCLYSISQV